MKVRMRAHNYNSVTAMATGGYVNAAMDTAPQCMVIAPDPLEGKVSVPSTLESIAEQE